MPGHENVEATAAVAGEVAVFAGTGCVDGCRTDEHAATPTLR
jgi:hypothetical protein